LLQHCDCSSRSNFGQSRLKILIYTKQQKSKRVFISILITLYINRQQAINSKSINNISSGEDTDLAIFFSRRCKGQGSEEAFEMSRRDEISERNGWTSMSSIWTGIVIAMDITEYSRERRLYADYLTDSRLLAQFRSSILFLNTQETISHLQAECTTKESLFSKRKRKKEWYTILGILRANSINQKSKGNKKKKWVKKIQED